MMPLDVWMVDLGAAVLVGAIVWYFRMLGR
jgi:hypothetical protein